MIYLASLAEQTGDKIAGCYIVKTKGELDRIVADNTQANKVIIRKDFAREYFTPSGLLKFIRNARQVNRNLNIEFDEKSDVITNTKIIKILQSVRNLEELLIVATKYPKEVLDCIRHLTVDFTESQEEMLTASSTVSRLQHIIDTQKKEISDMDYMLKIEQENKALSLSRLDALVKRINFQYNVGVDKNYLFNVDRNNYDKVIYIKEITRVQYVDSLVYYLKEILKVLYSMPARLLVIEPFYGMGKTDLYPDLVPHYALKERDVISGDILMLGIQPNLAKDILKNPSNISMLIVLDRAGYNVPHILGSNVEYIYTASDVTDVSKDIPKSRIISYQEDTLFIPYIKNFNVLDKGEKLSKYSSMSIIKKLIALIEGR